MYKPACENEIRFYFKISHSRLRHGTNMKHEPLTSDHRFGFPCECVAGGGAHSCLSVLHTAGSISISAVCSLIQGQEFCQCSHNLLEDVYAGKQTALIFMTSRADTDCIFHLVNDYRWCVPLLFLLVLTLTFLVFLKCIPAYSLTGNWSWLLSCVFFLS